MKIFTDIQMAANKFYLLKKANINIDQYQITSYYPNKPSIFEDPKPT
jgi:hypothetical protein